MRGASQCNSRFPRGISHGSPADSRPGRAGCQKITRGVGVSAGQQAQGPALPGKGPPYGAVHARNVRVMPAGIYSIITRTILGKASLVLSSGLSVSVPGRSAHLRLLNFAQYRKTLIFWPLIFKTGNFPERPRSGDLLFRRAADQTIRYHRLAAEFQMKVRAMLAAMTSSVPSAT